MAYLPASDAGDYFTLTISTKKASDVAAIGHLRSNFIHDKVTNVPLANDNRRRRWGQGLGYSAKTVKITSKPLVFHLSASDPNFAYADAALTKMAKSGRFNISVVGPTSLAPLTTAPF